MILIPVTNFINGTLHPHKTINDVTLVFVTNKTQPSLACGWHLGKKISRSYLTPPFALHRHHVSRTNIRSSTSLVIMLLF